MIKLRIETCVIYAEPTNDHESSRIVIILFFQLCFFSMEIAQLQNNGQNGIQDKIRLLFLLFWNRLIVAVKMIP